MSQYLGQIHYGIIMLFKVASMQLAYQLIIAQPDSFNELCSNYLQTHTIRLSFSLLDRQTDR